MNAKQNPTTGTRRPLISAPGRAGRSRTTRSWVIVAIVGLVLSIAPPVIAHEVVPGVDGEAIRTMVEENMDEFDIPGLALVVVKGSEIALLEGFGLADPENGIPVEPNETVFRIASVSKPLTALAVLRAASDGLLDLGADINAYLDFTVDDFDGTSATSAAILTQWRLRPVRAETLSRPNPLTWDFGVWHSSQKPESDVWHLMQRRAHLRAASRGNMLVQLLDLGGPVER